MVGKSGAVIWEDLSVGVAILAGTLIIKKKPTEPGLRHWEQAWHVIRIKGGAHYE